MDTLFFNGMFYLGNNAWAPGLLVDQKGILTNILSNEAEIRSYVSSGIQKIDMGGKWILPGFEDAHTHPAGRARTLSELDLREKNIGWEEAQSILKQKVRDTPENQWVVCHGWNESTWGKIRQEDLDRISSDHGILLMNISYHGGLLNKKGEELLKKRGTRKNHGWLCHGRFI